MKALKFAAIAVIFSIGAAVSIGAASPAAAQQFEIDRNAIHQGYQAAQDAPTDAAEVARLVNEYARLTSAAGDVLGDGEASLGWGDMVLLALEKLAWLIIAGGMIVVAAVYARVTGSKLEADDAARYREYLVSAYHFALNALAPTMRGKKLKVSDASPVVEWMLHYAEQLFPTLLEQFGGKEAARMRAWAIVDLDEGEAIPLAPAKTQPIAPGPDSVVQPIATVTPAAAP